MPFARGSFRWLHGFGAGWGLAGVAAAVLLTTSPAVRKGTRRLVVVGLAGGMRAVRGLTEFAAEMKQEFRQTLYGTGQVTAADIFPSEPSRDQV